MQRLRASIVLALVFVFSMALAFAQTSNGTIAGTVVDPSGAAIANAKVTAKSVQTGNVRTTTTNGVGGYRLESLIPGTYVVTVNADGFSQREIQNIAVAASVVTSVNANMVLGATTTVEVQATGEQLKTESGEISGTINSTQISELPIGNLNPYSLATTLPGVTTVTTSDFTNGTSYSVNGTRPRANNFLIEGQDNNDAGIHGQGLQPENLEAVKEVVVLTNSYSAEFGHGGGSVSNLVYKSGSNSFHGAVWDRILNSSLDAREHYDVAQDPTTVKSKYRENLFGFSIGGPVKKDKLFFFTSYQWDKYRGDSNAGLLTVPTDAGIATLQSLPQNQNITNLLTAYGSLRGSADPSGSAYKCIALGNSRPCVEVGGIQRSIGANSDAPEFLAKGDYLVTQNDTISLRYVKSNYTAPFDTGNFPDQLPGFDTTQYGASHNAGITYTHIFTPSLLNEFRMSYGRIGFTFDFRPETYANPLALGPTTSISGLTGWGAPSGLPQGRFHNTYQFQDSVSWTKGSHSFKFGVDIADTRVRDAVPFNFYGSESYTAGGGFTALANYIDDFSGGTSTMSKNFGSPIARPELVSQSYFAQDTWKVRSNFTLDYGLRWEYSGAPFNVIGLPALAMNNTGFNQYEKQKGDWEDFGPRFGFSYTPRFWRSVFGDNKTVIRGGFGSYYDQLFTNIVDNIQATAPAAASPTITLNSSTRGRAAWSGYMATLSPIATATNLSEPIVPHLLNPETLQWNLNIQRELPFNLLGSVAYVGTRGEHLLAQTERNPFDVDTGIRLDPTRGRIVLRDNTGDSMYHGLQAELTKKVGHGLMFNLAYTYSKFMDDTSEIFTSGNWSAFSLLQYPSSRKTTDWGLSAFDHRQRLALSYVYDVPKWNANGYLKPLAMFTNHWQFSGTTSFQSGSPGNYETGYDINGDGISNDRPLVSNPNAPISTFAFDGSWAPLLGLGPVPAGMACEGSAAWWTSDPCHVVGPNSVHFLIQPYQTNSGAGTVGRNTYISPWTQLWNFGIQRSFKIREHQAFDVRAEMFDAFNHANADPTYMSFTLLSSSFADPNVGTNSFADPNFAQRGHRSVRFLLKYSF
jgi:hypothetical protein